MILVEVRKFTRTPGFRYRIEGPFSGEEFYQEYLAPHVSALKNSSDRLLIDLTGTIGFSTAFLDGFVGPLMRDIGVSQFIALVGFNTSDSHFLGKDLDGVIARNKKKIENG